MASSTSTPYSKYEDLSLGLLNINGLRNKIPDIRHIIAHHKIHVLALCETKLDPTVQDSKLNIPGYRMYRKDRNGGGGGVALYIQQHLQPKRRRDLMQFEVEIIWVEMKLPDSKNKKVLVGCCYRPPRNCYTPPKTNKEYLDQICEMMEQVSEKDRDVDVFLLGDFNFNWFAKPFEEKDKSDSPAKKRLKSVVSKCRWTQIINLSTKETKTSSKCIDHIYTNIPESLLEQISTVTGCSDHNLITVRVSKKVPKMIIYYRSWKKFVPESYIRDVREAQWTDVRNKTGPQEALDKFNERFMKIVNKHAPIKTKSIYDSVMIDKELESLITKRDDAKKNKDTERYKELKDKVSKLSKKKQTDDSRKQLEETGNSPDKIFRIFEEFLGHRLPSHVINVKHDEELTKEAEFQEYLEQFQKQAENLKPVFDSFEAQGNLEDGSRFFSFQEVNPETVKSLLLSLCKPGIIGLNQTDAELLSRAADFISDPICHILNRCIVKGLFPSEWKENRNIPFLGLVFDVILLKQTKQYIPEVELFRSASAQDELKDVWLTEIENREAVSSAVEK